MGIRLPRLEGSIQVVDPSDRGTSGKPTITFVRYWQRFAEQIETAINAIAEILGITERLDAAIAQAQAAADDARAAADAAQSVANGAANNAEQAKREQALVNSGPNPASVLEAGVTTITIDPHVRIYGDGTTVNVNGDSVASTGPNMVNYVFYDDPTRAGGAVTYQASDTPQVQTGDRHVVGAVQIPAPGNPNNPGGSGPSYPGRVEP